MSKVKNVYTRYPKMLNDDSVDHIYCQCDSNVSLCGFDISELTDCGYAENLVENFCIVCLELEESPDVCERCGM